MTKLRCLFLACMLLGPVAPALAEAAPADIRGGWRPEVYRLKGGTQHTVTGTLFFGPKEWSVLFFVMGDKVPLFGSSEGGTYALEGQQLHFTHLYHLSSGQAVPGVPASGPGLSVWTPGSKDTPSEVCKIDLQGDRLTIHFPSGNAMTFRRVP